MKLFQPALLNILTFFGGVASARETARGPLHDSFELSVVAHEPGPNVVSRVVSGAAKTLPLKLPAALSSGDLRRVKAVTQSSWYVLSGRHSTSTLVLSLKPEAVARFQATLSDTIGRGDRLAIVVNEEVVGVLTPFRPLTTDEFMIDASFFSLGTEEQKVSDTRMLAKWIKSTLP